MEEKYLKNSIISFFLITSFILMPLSLIPRKAKAANINTYINGLSGVITQLPLCQGSIKTLFSGNSTKGIDFTTTKDYGIKSGSSSSSGNIIGSNGTTLSELNDLGTDTADAVKVDVGTTITKAETKSANANENTAAATEATKNNDTCFKSIGRAVIKMLLQKITTNTVSWINGGMDGDPLFVQDPGQYFKDIAKNEILGFAGEINDPTKYPFGKAFIQAEANSFNNKFANNAQYSLNKLIQDTNPQYNAQTFNQDFSQGGWSAWDALTQNPANNPLGFTLMASNELAKRIEDKTQLAQGSLQQSGGYLGVQKCVDPEGVTKQQDEDGRKERASSSTGPYQNEICNRWNFVTPGQMVAAAATKVVNYPDNNLLQAQDLNDAVAAILDAFLGHYSSSFMGEGGFAGLSDTSEFQQGSDGTFVLNTDNSTDYSSSQVGQDFSGFQVGASSFLSQNPNFNIRTDLNQALIDEQRIYADKLIQQNKELKSTIPLTVENNSTGLFTGNYGLIPTIYQLDYCIPGPHPGFEADSRAALDAALSVVVPETITSIADKKQSDIESVVKSVGPLAAAAVGMVVGAAVGSVVPVIGNAVGLVAGALVGYLVGLIGSSDDKKIRSYYAGQVGMITGIPVKINTSDNSAALMDKGPMAAAVSKILDRYIDIIHAVYKPELMPTVTQEAAGKYLQLRGYNQMFTNNEARIISIQSIVKRLGEIKVEIDRLNNELKNGTIKNPDNFDGTIVSADQQEAQYNENLKPWINAFGRISQEMVTGDDIAVVDNTIKQIVDEKDYVYNDLLKGPNGCEKDLEIGKAQLPPEVFNTKRMEYPGPILYDYNYYVTPTGPGGKKSEIFPDPYNSGYKNKINQADANNNVGPGFLSLISFQNTLPGHWSNLCPESQNGILNTEGNFDFSCNLRLDDLFPLQEASTYLGIYDATQDRPSKNGIFESMIGIY